MAIKKFTPQNSDLFLGKDQGDHTLGKFGHLNYILQQINNLGGTTPDDIYAVVDGIGPISIQDGDTVISLPATFVGQMVRVFRNNVLVDFNDMGIGDPYFTRDLTLNTITLSVAAVTDEKFAIQAYKKA